MNSLLFYPREPLHLVILEARQRLAYSVYGRCYAISVQSSLSFGFKLIRQSPCCLEDMCPDVRPKPRDRAITATLSQSNSPKSCSNQPKHSVLGRFSTRCEITRAVWQFHAYAEMSFLSPHMPVGSYSSNSNGQALSKSYKDD